MSTVQEEELKSYQEDLEEALGKGLLPRRRDFRNLLGLDLLLRIRVDYSDSIQKAFKNVARDFVIEGISDPEIFWEKPRMVGDGSGTQMLNMRFEKPTYSVSVDDIEISLGGTGERYATLGEALHFLERNQNVASRFPFVVVHKFDSVHSMAVFIGSLSGSWQRVIRFRPINQKWRGCRHLIVTP